MKIILCTGDSHTWGQGTKGLEKEFDPQWVGGELRLASFASGCYVNRLRRAVNQLTGSSADEWTAHDIAAMDGAGFVAPCAVVGAEGIRIIVRGGLLRIECALIGTESEISVCDGESVLHEETLTTDHPANAYRLITLHLKEGVHRISIKALRGAVHIYRIEAYSGPCAVVNSGVGSCPVEKFRSVYRKDYMDSVRPDVVLMEAHTINDWLTGDTPDEYFRHLCGLIGDVKKIGAVPVVLTVSPIGGSQKLDGLAGEYDEFIEASRQAAKASGAALCDANRMMKLAAEGMSEEDMKRYLFADNWHVNDRGHAMYAQMLLGWLMNEEWFREMEEIRK